MQTVRCTYLTHFSFPLSLNDMQFGDMESMLDISIIIVNWNTRDLLAECLESIVKHKGNLKVEVIVVDNASTDGSTRMVRNNYPMVRLIENSNNVGFAAANNIGLAEGRGRYLLLLNSDAFVGRGVLESVVNFLDEHSEAGICGVKLVNPDGTFQGSYAPFPTLRSELLLATGLGSRLINPTYPAPTPRPGERPREVDWIGGAFMLIRNEVYKEVGGMDEAYWMYSEETDWCYRIKLAGWKAYYLPQVTVTHLRGGSSRKRRAEMRAQLYRSKVRFFTIHYGYASGETLRWSLWFVFLLREILARVMLLLPSSEINQRWRERVTTAQMIRKACANPSP